MKDCRICGEKKDDNQFYRMKGFLDHYRRKIIWCQTCQQMFMDMKKTEKQCKLLMNKEWVFQVSFS